MSYILDVEFSLIKGIIYLSGTQNFRKTNVSYPVQVLIRR